MQNMYAFGAGLAWGLALSTVAVMVSLLTSITTARVLRREHGHLQPEYSASVCGVLVSLLYLYSFTSHIPDRSLLHWYHGYDRGILIASLAAFAGTLTSAGAIEGFTLVSAKAGLLGENVRKGLSMVTPFAAILYLFRYDR